MTPRGTDWGLAGLVTLGLAGGALGWFAGSPGAAWVVAAHAVAGFALALLVVVKVRRVAPRMARRHGGVAAVPARGGPRGAAGRARGPRRGALGLLALALVGLTLFSGAAWSTLGAHALAGYTVLAWHALLGAILGVGLVLHARVRAKRPRGRDLVDRRQFLTAAAMGAGALTAWYAQRPVERALGLPGARRRFTGSYAAGDAFPVTSWVADAPRPLGSGYRLAVAGLVAHPLTLTAGALDRGDELTATLDCTGGFYSTHRWRGVALGRLLDEAGVDSRATHVRVISHTGYRWSFALPEARRLLLATHVAAAPLSQGHGAPCRLVAPGHRGFQWVKWVTRIELHDAPDPGALASTVWSSLTPAGRGDD